MILERLIIMGIGALMLYGLFYMINEEREKNGKPSLGFFPTIIIAIIVILFWVVTS